MNSLLTLPPRRRDNTKNVKFSQSLGDALHDYGDGLGYSLIDMVNIAVEHYLRSVGVELPPVNQAEPTPAADGPGSRKPTGVTPP